MFTKLREQQLLTLSGGNDIQIEVQKVASSGRTKDFLKNLDIKGAITLAVTITSFLLALSYLDNTNANNLILVIIFSADGSNFTFDVCSCRKKSENYDK